MKIEPFALPDEKPDFDYWIRLDCWTVDEALFLIHGLTPPKGEPDPDCFPKDRFFRTTAWTFLANRELADSMRLLSDYLDTAIKAGLFDPTRINPEKLIQWALKKDLFVHEGLLISLKGYNYVEPQPEPEKETPTIEKSIQPEYAFRETGLGWEIIWNGLSIMSRETVIGFKYMHYCMFYVGQPLSSFDVQEGKPVKGKISLPGQIPLKDKEAKAIVEKELNDLREDLQKAEEIEDVLIIETIKSEILQLKKYKNAQHTFPDALQQINKNVGKAINDAISKIEGNNEEAGEHFRKAFKKPYSYNKIYSPDKILPWKLS